MQQATAASPDGRQHERRERAAVRRFPEPERRIRMSVNAAERDAMGRALLLARRGPRGVNPQVGAVILSPAGEVLAQGWHRGAGTVHAEVDALSQLPVGAGRGATAIVTLEPCNHTGRTGPCSEALISAGVARVIYA